MKELSIEDKAKRYDEAIEKAKDYYHLGDDKYKMAIDAKAVMEYIFPELKESDNKRMIQYFKDLAPFDKADELYEKYGFSHKDALAWLEKQAEHANFRNKIQIGDKVTRNEDGVLVNLSQLKRVAKKDDKQGEQKPIISNNALREGITHFGITQYQIDNWLKKYVDVEKQGEQKPVVIIPKFRVGDEIKTSNEESLTITKIDEKGYWSEDLFICCFDEECVWDLVEQNPAWNEEDEQYLLVCKNALAKYQVSDKWDAGIISRWLEDKLKSLKERCNWKPSESEVRILEQVIDGTANPINYHATLHAILEKLKKLREE